MKKIFSWTFFGYGTRDIHISGECQVVPQSGKNWINQNHDRKDFNVYQNAIGKFQLWSELAYPSMVLYSFHIFGEKLIPVNTAASWQQLYLMSFEVSVVTLAFSSKTMRANFHTLIYIGEFFPLNKIQSSTWPAAKSPSFNIIVITHWKQSCRENWRKLPMQGDHTTSIGILRDFFHGISEVIPWQFTFLDYVKSQRNIEKIFYFKAILLQLE